MLRHDNVLIDRVVALPEQARQRQNLTLSRDETTGRSQRIESMLTAELWEDHGMLYLQVIADSTQIIHEDGQSLVVPRGIYRVRVQREYTLLAS